MPGFLGGDGGKCVCHPVGEVDDVFKHIGAVGFGEKTVIGRENYGVVRDGEFEKPEIQIKIYISKSGYFGLFRYENVIWERGYCNAPFWPPWRI